MAKRGIPHGLPEIEAGQYLIEAMLALRPTRPDMAGDRPADWPEIEAFARLTGRVSDPWECETLFEMCQAYAAERQRGQDGLTIAPVER